MKLYTTKQAAEYLQLTERTIYRYIKEGKLRATKPGGGQWRISEDDLRTFAGEGRE